MKIKRYLEYITESKKDNFLDWIPFSRSKRPKSDEDIKLNKRLIRESVMKFDMMFGTQYFDRFGMDYQILVGSTVYYCKEVLESLTDEALKEEVYQNFDLTQEPDQTLYDNIMVDILTEDDNKDVLFKYITSKIPKMVYKQEILHKFFKKFGSEFNNDLIKEIFDTKSNYDLGESSNVMLSTIQREFLNSMKATMDRYQEKENKGVKKLVNSHDFFKNVIENFYESEFVSTGRVKELYLKKRLNDWFKWIKSNLL
jgi:hypothetical protein